LEIAAGEKLSRPRGSVFISRKSVKKYPLLVGHQQGA